MAPVSAARKASWLALSDDPHDAIRPVGFRERKRASRFCFGQGAVASRESGRGLLIQYGAHIQSSREKEEDERSHHERHHKEHGRKTERPTLRGRNFALAQGRCHFQGREEKPQKKKHDEREAG